MDGNSTSYSEKGCSSSSTRTSRLILIRQFGLAVIPLMSLMRRCKSAAESRQYVAITIADENDPFAQAPHNDGSYSSNRRSTAAPVPNSNQSGSSTQSRWPSLYLLYNDYDSKCVPLHKAALEGDWSKVKSILGGNVDESTLNVAITGRYQTVLHVATGAKRVNFVKQMLEELKGAKNLLKSPDIRGNTAFCFAAAVGSEEIARIMLAKDPTLLTILGGQQMTPLYFAALFGQSNMASFLYPLSRVSLKQGHIKQIFFISIENGLYGFALELLNNHESILALARHEKHGTALHMLARNPSAFTSSRPGRPQSFISLAPGNSADSSGEALELLKRLWEKILNQLRRPCVFRLIREPPKLLFQAAALGNFRFLAELIRSYPDLTHELDENNRSIFHIAVMHRHADIFNLINEIGFSKQLIMTFIDNQGNNLLHLASQYSNPKPVSKVAGPALEMQQELLTFKEIEMIVQPSFKEKKNNDKKTPWELFTSQHEKLLEEGEKWMKSRAKSCSIVATLVTTVVFQAAFTLPGGNDDRSGTPHFLTKPWFKIFIISNAIAFSCSLFSTLIFLSILITSSYREGDFLMRLPLKLIGGLITLFVSIAATALSFSSSIFLAYRDTVNVFTFITIILVFLPIAVYAFQQIRLLGDLLYSMYRLALFLNKVGCRKLKIV